MPSYVVERVQTGIRVEKRLLKVMKGLAEHFDITLGDLVEGIVLHAFEGRSPFGPETVEVIAKLKDIYGLDLDARAAHAMVETNRSEKAGEAKSAKAGEAKGA
jgi:hypothetical protein